MDLILKAHSVTVWVRDTEDVIDVDLDLPTAYPTHAFDLFKGLPATARISAQRGCGAQWVRENLRVEPTVIDTRSKTPHPWFRR